MKTAATDFKSDTKNLVPEDDLEKDKRIRINKTHQSMEWKTGQTYSKQALSQLKQLKADLRNPDYQVKAFQGHPIRGLRFFFIP